MLLPEIRRHQFPDIREKLKIGKSLSVLMLIPSETFGQAQERA